MPYQDRTWFEKVVTDYLADPGAYTNLHSGLVTALEVYERTDPAPTRMKIWIPFGESGGKNFYVNTTGDLRRMGMSERTRWLLEAACYDYLAEATQRGKEFYTDDDEVFTEMATIATDETLRLRLQVNPDRNRVGNPYIKVFSATVPQKGETRVARLHFKDDGMEYHRDNFLDWKISADDLNRIRMFLEDKNPDALAYTNWEMACYQWNYEYALIPGQRTNYFRGDYDEKNRAHPSYVPSTQKMPPSWKYDPPKGKGKRR